MDTTDQIREKVDIVSYINEFVTLKKAGRNFTATCPFHTEKTPSFSVSPERQMWHCFGCQKGGDIFTFLMEYEHIEFPEALRILAKRAGVPLTGRGYDTETTSKKESMYTINRQAAEYYHYILMNLSAGKPALTYLRERGVSEKVMKSFLLGFAPNGRRGLIDYLVKRKQHTKEQIEEVGLASNIGRDTIDFFRGRIVFPLFDHRENIVGFSGRTMDTTGVVKAKYINTRETLIYHKGEMFFGLNMTKDAIRKANQVVLVEGEFDVLSCFQNGVSHVVGVKGTALTEKQVQLLSRYAQKVTICFDGDSSGQKAMKRSLPILEKYNLQTTVVIVPDGKDPDDAIRENPVTFKQAVQNDISVYDFLLKTALSTYDKSSAAGKGHIASELLPIYGEITNEVVKEHYLKKLSNELDTTLESLQKELQRQVKREQSVPVPQATSVKVGRTEMLEEYLLALIFQDEHTKDAFAIAWDELSEAVLPERASQKVLLELSAFFLTDQAFSTNAFAAVIAPELTATVNKAALKPLPGISSQTKRKEEITNTARQLRELYLRKRIKDVGQELKEAVDLGGEEQAKKLQEQFERLVSLLKK